MATSQLRMLVDEIIKRFKTQAENIKTEDEAGELEEIVIDLLDAIPITIVQKDYCTRTFIRGFLPKEKREDTELVNKLMQKCYDKDIVYLYDLDFCSNMEKIIEEITEE